MDLERFFAKFDRKLPARKIARPSWVYRQKRLRRFFDPCPNVPGVSAPKNLRLLNLAYSCLDEREVYLEVGTHQGRR